MIYLDNAATTRHKPDCVVEAVTRALCSLGNPGRGAHEGSLDADRVVFDTRLALAELFHAEGPERIAFAANATEALNIAIKGILQPGDHVITTAMEHNSVLRPLYEMEDRGAELTILPADRQGRLQMGAFEAAIRPNTRLYSWLQPYRKPGRYRPGGTAGPAPWPTAGGGRFSNGGRISH